MRPCAANLVVYTVLIGCAQGQSPIQAAEDPAPIMIVDGRKGMGGPSDGSSDKPAEPAEPAVLQAIAVARSYWSGENPSYEERLRVWESATGAFTRPGVEQRAVLFMLSAYPRSFPSMGLAILEGDQLVRNIAFATIAQTVWTLPDLDGDGRDELAIGGTFMGQGMVTQGVTLAAFGEEGLVDFGTASIFEDSCDAGYGAGGAFAARLSVVPGSEIMVEQFRKPSCESETWEPVGEPEPLQPIPATEKTVYTEISVGVTATD